MYPWLYSDCDISLWICMHCLKLCLLYLIIIVLRATGKISLLSLTMLPSWNKVITYLLTTTLFTNLFMKFNLYLKGKFVFILMDHLQIFLEPTLTQIWFFCFSIIYYWRAGIKLTSQQNDPDGRDTMIVDVRPQDYLFFLLFFQWGSCCSIFSFLCIYLSIIVSPFDWLLYYLFLLNVWFRITLVVLDWLLHCLSVFDLRLKITTLVSSNLSYTHLQHNIQFTFTCWSCILWWTNTSRNTRHSLTCSIILTWIWVTWVRNHN